MWRAREASSSLTPSLISGRQPTGPNASPPSPFPVGVCRVSAGSQRGAQGIRGLLHDTCFSAESLCTTVKTAQQKSCSPGTLAEEMRSSVCVEGSRPARSCGMAAGGVREIPQSSSAEAPIGVQRGAGTKVLAKPQVAARSAVRSVPVTVIILPVALPGSPERRCARSAD